MPVFDGKMKTATRISLDGDDWTPSMGTLAKNQCPAEKALVHGDQELVIEENLTSLVMKSRSYVTNQHCTNTICGDHKLTEAGQLFHFTGGKQQRIVSDKSILTFIGPVVSTFIGALTETHSQPRNVHEPTTRFESVLQALKQHNVDVDYSLVSVQGVLASELYFKTSVFGFTVTGYEDTKFNLKKEDAKIEIHSTVYTKVVMTNIHVSGLFLISGTSVSAGPKLAPNSICM